VALDGMSAGGEFDKNSARPVELFTVKRKQQADPFSGDKTWQR